MKYFIDTEFLEGKQDIKLFGFKITEIGPTIDLISIGIVAEDGREYYSISKEFNLDEAWNRYDIKEDFGKPQGLGDIKEYWIRENVLFPIWKELFHKDGWNKATTSEQFTLKSLKYLINKYGKSNKQISKEIIDFCNIGTIISNDGFNVRTYYKFNDSAKEWFNKEKEDGLNPINYSSIPSFYGYYCDYDWVVFCWLFGKMIDLPKGFPMYCKDLKQELDKVVINLPKELFRKLECNICTHNVLQYLEETGVAFNLDFRLKMLKNKHPEYPVKKDEHNALVDARWNKELDKFLTNVEKELSREDKLVFEAAELAILFERFSLLDVVNEKLSSASIVTLYFSKDKITGLPKLIIKDEKSN